MRTTIKRYICTGCKARYQDEATNHEGPIYMDCPVCSVEKPMEASQAWVPAADRHVHAPTTRFGIVPMI